MKLEDETRGLAGSSFSGLLFVRVPSQDDGEDQQVHEKYHSEEGPAKGK